MNLENKISNLPSDNCDIDYQEQESISKQFQQLLFLHIFLMELAFHNRILDEFELDYNIDECIDGASSSDVFR